MVSKYNRFRDWYDTQIMLLRLFLARQAIKRLGLETIYWAAPLDWEAYMAIGEPTTADTWNRKDDSFPPSPFDKEKATELYLKTMALAFGVDTKEL